MIRGDIALLFSHTRPTEEYLFENVKNYAFLSNGNVQVPGVNDASEYADTLEAMNIMGLSEEEQAGELVKHKSRSDLQEFTL